MIPLARYREKRNGIKTDKSKAELLLEHLEEFTKPKFNMRNGVLFVDPDDIICARQAVTILFFTYTRKDEVVSVSLKDGTATTSASLFRISRSAIINLKYLTKIDRRNKACIVQKTTWFSKSPVPLNSLRSWKIVNYSKIFYFMPEISIFVNQNIHFIY